jgi:hypothetical protein
MQFQEDRFCSAVRMLAALFIPMFHDSWHDVVRLHYGVRASMMVHGDKETIQ